MSALTTEHFVLQTAASATVTESASRTSLYVFSLSSSLVALGFVSHPSQPFSLFAAAVLPALFMLGIFTIVRLVDTGLEYKHVRGIARIRGYYRTLTPEAAVYFSERTLARGEVGAAALVWRTRRVLDHFRDHDRVHQQRRGGDGCDNAGEPPPRRRPDRALRGARSRRIDGADGHLFSSISAGGTAPPKSSRSRKRPGIVSR